MYVSCKTVFCWLATDIAIYYFIHNGYMGTATRAFIWFVILCCADVLSVMLLDTETNQFTQPQTRDNVLVHIYALRMNQNKLVHGSIIL